VPGDGAGKYDLLQIATERAHGADGIAARPCKEREDGAPAHSLAASPQTPAV
jgi:hypothetical protein